MLLNILLFKFKAYTKSEFEKRELNATGRKYTVLEKWIVQQYTMLAQAQEKIWSPFHLDENILAHIFIFIRHI